MYDHRILQYTAAAAVGISLISSTPAEAQCSPELTVKLTLADAEAGDRFGGSVSVSGDTAIISATGDDIGGAAYVYRNIGGVWRGNRQVDGG